MADDDDDLLFDTDDDDDDEADYEDDDVELDAAGADGAGGDADLDDIDIDDIDLDAMDFGEDELDEKPPRSKKKVVVLALAGIFLFAMLSAGGALMLLGGDETADQAGLEIPEGAIASLAIPPKARCAPARHSCGIRWPTAKQRRRKCRRQNRARVCSRPPQLLNKYRNRGRNKSRNRHRLRPLVWPGNPAHLRPTTSRHRLRPATRPQAGGESTPNSESAAAGITAPGPSPAAGSTQVAGARNIGGAGMIVPAITAAAYTGIRPAAKARPLSAPNPRLIETVDGRILPKIGDNGRESRKEYAHRFGGDPTLPRIGIIIRELGLSRNATLASINDTSALITLSFTPYARGVEEWMGLARSNGHEAILELPLETIDFPSTDPGSDGPADRCQPRGKPGPAEQADVHVEGLCGHDPVYGLPGSPHRKPPFARCSRI